MVYIPDEGKVPKYEPPAMSSEEEDEEENDEEKEGGKGAAAGDDAEGGGGKKGGKRDAREAALEAARERAKRAKANADANQGWFDLKKNTSVYVTGIPDDATIQEVAEVFGKCGIIKEDPETRQPKIKLYKDPVRGALKGDGLVTFLKEPSVGLAINLLDQAPFRYGLRPMSVSLAKFEQKGEKFVKKESAATKKKKKKALEAQEKRALGWKGFDAPVLKATDVVVILKGLFTPSELSSSPAGKAELEADVVIEATKAGPVEKVRAFEENPEGVVSVRFKTKEGADACIALMDGRWFAGRQVKAFKYDGYTNYNVKAVETEEEQMARLEKFAAELEAGDGGGGEAASGQ